MRRPGGERSTLPGSPLPETGPPLAQMTRVVSPGVWGFLPTWTPKRVDGDTVGRLEHGVCRPLGGVVLPLPGGRPGGEVGMGRGSARAPGGGRAHRRESAALRIARVAVFGSGCHRLAMRG